MRPASEELPPWTVAQVVDTVLGAGPVPMGVLNLELRHVRINAALARLYGVEPERVVGITPVELLGHLGAQITARCGAVASTGRPQLGHLVNGVATGGGAEVHWQVDCMPLQGPGASGALLLVVTDVTARTRAMRRLNEQRRALAYQASHDPVTRLANRFQLLEVLRHQQSLGRHPGLLLVDLDGFKEVNDTHGHAAGDHVLSAIAQRLQEAVGGEDLVARYGGDEFVVVCGPDRSLESVAEQVEAAITAPITWRGTELRVGGSVGIAVAQPDDTVTALLHRADSDMYRVKMARRRGG